VRCGIGLASVSKLVRFAFVDDNAVDLTVIDRRSQISQMIERRAARYAGVKTRRLVCRNEREQRRSFFNRSDELVPSTSFSSLHPTIRYGR